MFLMLFSLFTVQILWQYIGRALFKSYHAHFEAPLSGLTVLGSWDYEV